MENRIKEEEVQGNQGLEAKWAFLKQINSSLTLPCHGTQGGVLTDDLSFNIRLPGCGLGNLQVKSLCVRDIGGGKNVYTAGGRELVLKPWNLKEFRLQT